MSAPSQFPKTCPCCLTVHTAATWAGLPLIGEQVDEVEAMELRNCACQSTLAVITAVFDEAVTPPAQRARRQHQGHRRARYVLRRQGLIDSRGLTEKGLSALKRQGLIDSAGRTVCSMADAR